MNSFNLTAVGNLSKDPEHAVKGDTTYTSFCLVGNDYAGKDEEGNAREIVTTLWFVAFNGLGEAIAKNVRKGDQLIVDAQLRSDNWTDKDGEKHYDHSFIVQGFRFGAPGKVKREELRAAAKVSSTRWRPRSSTAQSRYRKAKEFRHALSPSP
jgi:single-strand DNA-binding protein